ncbi:hypothetical protein RJ640_007679 [Escallonia rubra]|uniref:TCP domain-containing protein n=1 Tax=Escallonia rubra TaxID=112253 RepID=A0AA88R1I3_9ASTE|nr:hypothetical protein RJ640_007679 [Escallonia rubra]
MATFTWKTAEEGVTKEKEDWTPPEESAATAAWTSFLWRSKVQAAEASRSPLSCLPDHSSPELLHTNMDQLWQREHYQRYELQTSMEVDGIQSKYMRIGNNKIGRKVDELRPDDEEDGDVKRGCGASDFNDSVGGRIGRLYWWLSSRIFKVSRTSGRKDCHGKVLTSKGLRDRLVRLFVTMTIQFYNLWIDLAKMNRARQSSGY